MPGFGNESIIEIYKVPWLIWIQLLVMILLIFLLLFGLSIFNSDPSSSSAAASPSNRAATPPAPATHINKPSSSHRRTKVDNQRVRRGEGNSGTLIKEDDETKEEPSSKHSSFFRIFQYLNHPCSFIRLLKRTLLKCFGLDSRSEISSSHQHRKEE